MSKVTIVTGIWDIKRSELSEGWNRSFNHYLIHLSNLMVVVAGAATRIGRKVNEAGKLQRFAKSTGEFIN